MSPGKTAFLLVVAGLLLAPAAPADAGQADPAGPIAQSPTDDGRRTVRRFPANVLRAAVGVLHADNLGPLLAGGTATAAGSLLDDDVAAWVADPEHGFGNSVEDGAAPLLPVVGRRTRAVTLRTSSRTSIPPTPPALGGACPEGQTSLRGGHGGAEDVVDLRLNPLLAVIDTSNVSR